MKIVVIFLTVHLSEANLGEKVSLNWLFSPSFELREKLKCIEHKMQNCPSELLSVIMKILRNFSLQIPQRWMNDL